MNKDGILLCPADTIWGLSCDPTNDKAIEKIIHLKQRSASKSFIVLINSNRQLQQCIQNIPDIAWDLIELTEEPLTLIMKATSFLSPKMIHHDGTLGIRFVRDGFCHDLIQAFNKPLLSTSPNISSKQTPMTFNQVEKEIIDGVDYVIPDSFAGKMNGKPSKIIKIEEDGRIQILRK